MSTEKDNSNDTVRLLEINSATNKIYQIRLYYVRMHDTKDELKVQAEFGKHIKFTFGEGKHLGGTDSFGPVLYILDLMLKKDDDGQLCVDHKDQFKSIGEYRLNNSYVSKIGKHFIHEEKRDIGHSLYDYLDNEHLFLFDIRFHSYYGFHLPGEDTGLFIDFCLFTYFLLHDQKYDIFNTLALQFQITLLKDNYTFNRHDFNDFFEKCIQYFPNIPICLQNDFITLRIILRMIGLLAPIRKETFDRSCSSANEFTNKIMFHIRTNFKHLLTLVDESEWPHFKSGLVTLCSFELLYEQLGNKLTFLHQIVDENQRQDIANALLLQLFQLEQPILADSNWTDIFTIVDPHKIEINHLNLSGSFETFIDCITKISRVIPNHYQFEEQIVACFENRVLYNHLRIDLKSILFLLKFLEQEPLNEHVITQHFLSTIQSAIRNSSGLKEKIKDYFDKLEITIENMEEIWIIIYSIYKFPVLDYIDKYKYLEKSLSNIYSYDYYIKWFQCFLANNQIRDDIEKNKCKQLLQSWINRLGNNYTDFIQILIKIDELLVAFDKSNDNDWFRSYFINQITELCFQQDSIFSVINDGLLFIQNELFRVQFQKIFDEKYLKSKQKDLFKEITNNHNPLFKLIELDKRENSRSMLVRNLIELICDKIEITKDDLMCDTFYQPTKSTFTYMILFEKSLITLPIHIKIVKELIKIWNEWENYGFEVLQIKIWNKLRDEQREISCYIWNSIGKIISFEKLIDESNKKIKEIIKIKENITFCINNYCQNAYNRNDYFNYLQDIEKQFNREKIYSIKIPKEIQDLQPFADRLNPIFKSHVWRIFLDQHISMSFDQSSSSSTDELCMEDLNEQPMTCLTILERTGDILDLFITHIRNLWANPTQPFLSQLEELFPEKCLIDYEFDILKLLLEPTTVPYVTTLLHYWKNRENIDHICKGCINLLTQYDIQISEKLSILQNILEINEQTTGQTCIDVYHEYCTLILKSYPEQMLNFISQWSLSKKLLDFLYSLTATDVDNLLEVVNDWDETLINTKTVLEFVLLKSFFDQADVLIKSIQIRKSLELNDIIICFEQIWKKNEFKNILNVFKLCSASLSSIQHIYTASTDKEQSKRKRILDIMQKAHFGFCVQQSKDSFTGIEHEFDVCVIDDHSKSIYFKDLSELRDRARLIEYASNNSNKVQNYTENDIQQLGSFILFAENIEAILKCLTALNRAGYPSVTQFLLPDKEFLCYQGSYDELERFKFSLEMQLIDWDKQLCTMYEKCIDITYFSYQQIWIVEKFLYKQTARTSNDRGYHLLKFIGIDPESISSELLPPFSDEFHDRLKNIAQILNTQRRYRNSPVYEYKQIFLIQTSYKGILRAIVSLFHRNNISVSANQLFYCTKNTNWIEIRAFIYRCFYSQTLHQLIQPELLSLLIQDQLAQLLNQLIEKCPNHLFRLGIITTVSSAYLHIVNGLKTHCLVQTIYDQGLLSETALDSSIRTLIGDNCTLVTSRIAGLGKSTYIQNEILQLGKKHVKFTITGDVDIDTLMERLRDEKIQSEPATIAIHINIGPVENVQQLNEFLYSLVLFRCFRLGQTPVYIPSDMPIYIELDSSSYLSNIKDEIVIFQYLKTKYIHSMNLNDLEFNSSAIQLVANYLVAIDDTTINKKNINEETMTTLNKSVCIRFLQKHFLSKKNTEFISWTQLSIFIAVYYKLFSSFSKCGHFYVESDPAHGTKSSLRIDLLTSLLNSSDQFTSLSVETVRKNQRSIHSSEDIIPFSEAIIRWDKSQPFTLIFTSTYEPLFIYKALSDVPSSLTNAFLEYYKIIYRNHTGRNKAQELIFSLFNKQLLKSNTASATPSMKKPEQQLQESLIDPNQMTHEQFFIQLASLTTKYILQKSMCEICFNQYDYYEQQCKNCSIKDSLIIPISGSSQDIEDFQKRVAKSLHSEYVLTADNYIKMLLIYLRIQSNLPVLIMGETGCGKTALIQCLCQKILDDEMKVFHIHAGVTNEKIIETMLDFMKQAQKCSENEQNKRLWVFLDEFNTTPNIGLLKEIVCERTLLGEPLPNNMVFLGACNPQRRKKNKEEVDDNIGIKTYHLDIQRRTHGVDQSFLYSVVPIPETMLEHIWDYGYLDEATEKNYIKTILNACEQLTTNRNWFDCIINSISESHKFFREREDVSSVSLRDVARFCRFYNWFYKSPALFESKKVSIWQCFNHSKRASLLALFLCYYFRLNSSTKRKEYMTTIENHMKKFRSEMYFYSLNSLLENEKMALVQRMELPPGTAKNRALTDNIFVLFTCILNRIPVILCGKPGSSKTSAIQIVISNLKGKKSEDSFFQTLPELIAISYQGSHNCTSESIIKVFAQADKCTQAKNDTELLPVIVFDEIGLAELSPHNPLKVLHSELEIETCRYGFVGLSNWRLDASKMNRAIYLSCPDPDLNDLKITAITLSQSMLSDDVQTVPLDDSIIQGLADAYMKMCEHMKQHRNQHYFGLRDYYSLIKGIVYDILQKENKGRDEYEIIRHHLSLNFDGTIDGSKFMWSAFCKHMHQDHKVAQYSSPTFDQLIHQSLSSRTGRFLMLIGESESAFDYVQQYIITKHSSIQTRTLIGSTLTGDFLSNATYAEQYNTRVLMDIILYAEKDVILFLRGLGHLYDNLYDLFNQNFAVSAKKKFCRIALGSLYHPRCVIHDNFYCVVFVKQQDLDKYDPPFLNRFEKHLIDMDILIHQHHKTVIETLIRWIDQVLSIKSTANFLLQKHFFIEFSNDYIVNLVTDAYDHLKISDNYNNDQDVLKYCQDQLIRTSSFDLSLLLSLESKNDWKHLIQRYYEIHTHLSFSSFINQIFQEKKIPKLLIYTYTQIYHVIDYSGIDNHHKWIEEVKLSHFKTELELMQKMKVHYQIGPSRLLLIRVDYHEDHEHISMLKHILINEQFIDESRGVCLIFHLQRNKLNQTNNDVFFNGWSRVMIDDLQKNQIIPQNILMNPSYGDLVIYLDFLNLETTFDELINRCIMQFRYIAIDTNCEDEMNERRDRIIQQLTLHSHDKSDDNHQSLRSLIKKHLSELIRNIIPDSNQSQFKDWRQDLLTNEIIIGSCRSLNDALTKTVSFFLDKYLALFLAYLEKHSLFDSYLFLIDSNQNIRAKLYEIWFDCLTTTLKKIDISVINQNCIEIPLIFDLHLPCATIEYEIIRQIRETIAQDRQDNDQNWMDFAYKQLTSKSIYGQYINKILDNPDLFDHYYHDQLTLARNEANIYQLSTSFVQRLLTKISGSVKDQLIHLFIDYEDLFEIMRIFEIGIPFIGEEDMVLERLAQQFIIQSDTQEIIADNDTNLYRLVIRESNFHLIHPGSSTVNEKIFECNGNPFIEISLMNLLELLISPTNIDRINNMEQLITIYGLLIQNMITLSHYGHYEISNLEKVHSFLRLASCISNLFPSNKALDVFKKIYSYNGFCITFDTLYQIHNSINFLNNVIHEQQSTANETIIHQTLIKFENELLRNWSIENTDQSSILKFIDEHNLWRCSAKVFTLIDKSFKLSSTIRENNGQIPQIDEYNEINQYLCQLNDSTRKIEVLLTIRIYMQLILDENYQSKMNENNKQHLTGILIPKFDHFKEDLYAIEHAQDDQKLEMISLIAWLKYYILYYVYALKNDIRDGIMQKIDEILVKDTSSFCSTVKLYIIKQLCQLDNVVFHDLCGKYANRNIVWISSMITPPSNQRPLNAQRDVILPTPLFECHNEFIRINEELTSHITNDQLKELIIECSKKQDTTYCFIIWFIHYYTRFHMSNILPDDRFVRLIEHDVSKELITCFEPIGYKLIYSLCNNFDKKSYFQLKPFLSEEDLHQRLLVLNIIALLISFKSFKSASFFGFLLFDEHLKMPLNYTEHFKKLDYLTGVAVANDSALIQMINIRTQIDNHLESRTDIFRCSSDCFWLFYFVNCNIPDEQNQCPLCKKEINISRNGDLLVINKPHIQMDMNETLQFISKYIEQHKQKDRLNILTKPDQSLTCQFMSFFTNAIFLFLHELNYMSNSSTIICDYFRERIKTHYTLLRKHLSDVDQCYIWLYKMINHMIDKNFVIKGYLNSPEKVIQFEKLIEESLILPHINSVIAEIREYKSVYADFVYGNDKKNTLINFVDELIQDDNKYPLLNFFNVTNIHSINIIDHFHSKLQLLPNHEKTYPLTTFLLKRLSDYDNIQYLYAIIKFMNYLMQQFDHRINRNDAKIKTIAHCLKDNSDLKTIYEQFLDVWYKISLKEVYFDQTKYEFQHSHSKHNFDNKTNISMFLLDKSNDNENMIPAACLQTIGNLQNDIFNYFYSYIVTYKDDKYRHRVIPIQSIQQKHLFHFDTNQMRKLLVEKGLMINYTYGMGKEIIYDYEEIEWTLRNEISCLPWIDIKNIRYFNYQFDLYHENISLINDIRQRFEQKLFNDSERAEIKRVIYSLDKDSIFEISGLLEYILIYLRTVNNKNIIETSTIQIFINEYIHSKGCINNQIFGKGPFSSIHLKYIIDLYELIEECIFDEILSNNIRNELCEKSFPVEQRTSVINQFIDMILHNENLADCFKNLICWISMLKRLLVRLLSPKVNINFESSLHEYVKRTDMWKQDITDDNIRTIEIKSNICLKHAFIILKGLEAEQNEKTSIEKHKSLINTNHEQLNNKTTIQKTSVTSRSMNSLQGKKQSIKKNDLR